MSDDKLIERVAHKIYSRTSLSIQQSASLAVEIRNMFEEHSVMNAVSMGKKGGLARAAKLSPQRRLDISLKAAAARWHSK